MDTTTIVIIVAALFILVLFAISFKGNAISKAVKEAQKTHDIAPIVAAIDADKTADIPTVYNSAIKTLWDSYDRETATDLIKALLERNDEAPISQLWLKTALDVEPEIARTRLGADFINSHYKEGIAAKCAGCCGSCKSCKS